MVADLTQIPSSTERIYLKLRRELEKKKKKRKVFFPVDLANAKVYKNKPWLLNVFIQLITKQYKMLSEQVEKY